MSMRSLEVFNLLCTKIGPNHQKPNLRGKGVRARVLAKCSGHNYAIVKLSCIVTWRLAPFFCGLASIRDLCYTPTDLEGARGSFSTTTLTDHDSGTGQRSANARIQFYKSTYSGFPHSKYRRLYPWGTSHQPDILRCTQCLEPP